MPKTKQLSYTCPCGVVHPCQGVWLAAHWHEQLRHTCTSCGAVNTIQAGEVIWSHKPGEEEGLKTYDVTMQVFGTMTVKVKAQNAEEAKKKAREEACVPTLCWHCERQVKLRDEVGEVIDVEEVEGEEED